MDCVIEELTVIRTGKPITKSCDSKPDPLIINTADLMGFKNTAVNEMGWDFKTSCGFSQIGESGKRVDGTEHSVLGI